MTISLATLPPEDNRPDAPAGLLHQLKMTAAADQLPALLREAEQQEPSYARFLHDVLNHELSVRVNRRAERHLKQARLHGAPDLEAFDFSLRPQLKPAPVKQLLGCDFIREGRSVICIGRPGTGKTHVARAVAHAACLHGFSVLAVNAGEMLDQLEAERHYGDYLKAFKRLTSVDLLLIDEIGYLPLDRPKADHLFRLVRVRHPTRSMIVTTNTPFTHWERFFPSEAQAVATIDRLLDRATVLRFSGKSSRGPREVLGAADDE